MSSKTLSVGDYIDSKCTKCKMETNHIIVAMVGEKVARVECQTCSGVHNYRPPKPEKKAAAGRSNARERKPSAASRRAAKVAEEIEAVRGEIESGQRQAKAYDMQGAYRVDDAVSHPHFGIGLVKTVTKPNKMEVQFEEGLKCLRCQL